MDRQCKEPVQDQETEREKRDIQCNAGIESDVADRTEQDGVGSLASLERGLGHGGAGGVDGTATEQVRREREGVAEFPFNGLQGFQGFPHDLGANAVAG